MKKFAFTFAEIVVAIVVMAVVVATVVPITRDKFVKADYTSYYAAYKNLQNVVSEVMLGIVNTDINEEESPCAFKIDQTCYNTPFTPTPVSLEDCEAMISTHGIKACFYNNDYWAGAVKACGHINKMPKMSQLAELANYLYGTTDISTYTNKEGINLNATLAQSLGFAINSSGAFYVWSGNESASEAAHSRFFAPTFSNGDMWNMGRYNSDRQAVCLVEDTQEETTNYTTQFCDSMKNTHASPQNSCTEATSSVQTAVTSKDFSSLTPHITFSNGLKMYMASDLEEISALSDSVDEADREGFVVYVDVDGTRSKSKLYDDVFPFYLTKSGKVIPGYDASIIAGANCEKSLAFDILYDDFSSGDRKLKRLDGTTLDNTDTYSFKNAACLSGYVKSLKYCGFDPAVGKEVNGINCNTNTQADCRIRVRKPIRIFN